MKIRLKAFSVVGLSSSILIIITLIALKVMFSDFIHDQEIKAIKQNFDSFEATLSREEMSLERITLDWSQWDDTYFFIEDANKKYIDGNLQESTLEALNLNFFLYYNVDRKLIYSLKNTTLSGNELDQILNAKNESILSKASEKPATGLLKIGEDVAFISAAPVTTTDGHSPVNGYLVIGRILDKGFFKYLEELVKVDLRVITQEEFNKIDEEISAAKYDGAELLTKVTEIDITSYSRTFDIFGKDTLVLRQNFFRNVYYDSVSVVGYFASILFFALLVITIISILVMDKVVTKPLKIVHDFMWNVGKTRDISARLSISGSDEISELGYLTNNMLGQLEDSYEEMRLIKERFRITLEATTDGYIDTNLLTNEVYVSGSWLEFMGYAENQGPVSLSQCMGTIADKEDREKLQNILEDCRNKKTDIIKFEMRVAKNSGEIVWVIMRGRVVQYGEDGQPERCICTLSDITERKNLEDKSRFLSQTDLVTGLKNRAYLEELMNKTEKHAGEHTWIIMGDVNGLKLINDSFGHTEGDRLLKTIGNILRDCCSKDDIPARWGGDEFVVYVRNKSEEYVQNLINCITEACERAKNSPIKVSITLGYANRGSDMKSLNAVLKRAEEGMYRHKLLESRSTRSSIIASLEQTLHEKHIETLEHTKRIRKMCVKVGNRMGLSHEEMDELVLLGALHDIGKIGIPESILMKPGALTEEEWSVMKKHTEIGYRIAAATPELAHIADEILYHHERYDGTGYPHGLAGKSIPKLARVISIVDSFDVMTHERVYKEMVSVAEAVEELYRCSGKQFDPEIVELFIASLKLDTDKTT